VIAVDRLRTARVAALGLDTTSGTPPVLTEISVLHLAGGVITGGPWTYWVQPDVPMREIRPCARPNVRFAPSWPEVAERLADLVGGRILAMHDASRWEVLRRQLPDWEPAGLVFTRELASEVWPGLAGYDLPSQRSSALEAHAVGLLLAELLRDALLPLHDRRGGYVDCGRS
jgi:hypothetical protein